MHILYNFYSIDCYFVSNSVLSSNVSDPVQAAWAPAIKESPAKSFIFFKITDELVFIFIE